MDILRPELAPIRRTLTTAVVGISVVAMALSPEMADQQIPQEQTALSIAETDSKIPEFIIKQSFTQNSSEVTLSTVLISDSEGEPTTTTTTAPPEAQAAEAPQEAPPPAPPPPTPEQQAEIEFDRLHPQLKKIMGWCEAPLTDAQGNKTGRVYWQAQNPKSSASGGAQALNSTWKSWTKNYGTDILAETRNYARMKDAPPLLQVRMADRVYMHEGTTPWEESRGCWAPGTRRPRRGRARGRSHRRPRHSQSTRRH